MASPGLAESPEFTLAPRMASAAQPWLSKADRMWLNARGPLTLGVAATDHPPLGILDAHRFQGITADYLGLLFSVPVQIRPYASRDAALQALRDGEIDLVGDGTPLESSHKGLQLSEPYLPNQPVLVSAVDKPFNPRTPGTRLAMTAGYLLRARMSAAYPNSELLLYESPRRALEALSLGEVDAFVGDTVSAHYLLQANYLLNLRIQGFTPIESRGFGFLLRPDDEPLLDYINQALPEITAHYGDDILRSWSAGHRLHLSDSRVVLTPAESRWLAAHPVIPVALNGSLGALGHFDAFHRAQGIGPDYMELIARYTGLQFEYLHARNYADLERMMGAGKALLTPVFAPTSSAGRNIELLAPYLRTSVVVMARTNTPAALSSSHRRIHRLQELEGRRISMVSGFFLESTIREQYPEIQLQSFPDLTEALHCVAERRCDAFVGNDYAARYENAQRLDNQLQLTGILDDYTRPISLAVQAGAPELRSILAKAQLSITPDEVADIVRNWEPRQLFGGSFWREHRQLLLRLASALALLAAISLAWGLYLSRQVGRTRRAQRHAQAASLAKSQFLATMSHEIRTPLSAIIGLLELAQEKAGQGMADRKTLTAAQDAAQGMLMLLGNVLDLERIESGRLDSTPRPFALKPMIEDMAALLQGLAHRKQLSLQIQVADSMDCSVVADPLHLKQVLFNLLSNAIKFTERGSVTLHASGQCQDRRLLVQLQVMDTGIGISPQDQARLFLPFSQLDAAGQDQACGSGLGLSITRRLVEHMGGSIALESTPQQGSCFRVQLSLELAQPAVQAQPAQHELADQAAAPAPMPPSRPQRAGAAAEPAHWLVPLPGAGARAPQARVRVLVAEDYLFHRELIKSQLMALGQALSVSVAEDGRQAWELCQREHFHLLITDGRMPGMDGVELSRRIRARENGAVQGRCRIVALTASTDAREAQRYLAAGADEVLHKPVSIQELRRVVMDAAGATSCAVRTARRPAGHGKSGSNMPRPA